MLDKLTVKQFAEKGGTVFSAVATTDEVRNWLYQHKADQQNYFIVVNEDGTFRGVISSSNLFSLHHAADTPISSLIKRKPFVVTVTDTLKTAVEMMAKENMDVLPVVAADNRVTGILSYRNILAAYKYHFEEHQQKVVPISLKRRTLKVLLHSRIRLALLKVNEEEKGQG